MFLAKAQNVEWMQSKVLCHEIKYNKWHNFQKVTKTHAYTSPQTAYKLSLQHVQKGAACAPFKHIPKKNKPVSMKDRAKEWVRKTML